MRTGPKSERKTIAGEWGPRLLQKSLKDCRITVLGTGDIGSTFARRAKAFEPKNFIPGIDSDDLIFEIYGTEPASTPAEKVEELKDQWQA